MNDESRNPNDEWAWRGHEAQPNKEGDKKMGDKKMFLPGEQRMREPFPRSPPAPLPGERGK
jgi:hypothetical protein